MTEGGHLHPVQSPGLQRAPRGADQRHSNFVAGNSEGNRSFRPF
jgi:hypothetical protein